LWYNQSKISAGKASRQAKGGIEMEIARQFYRCDICGNLVGMIEDGGGELVCCGEPMRLLEANTTDAATEKHVPVCTRDGNALHVVVGSVAHPMLEAHYIQWICVAQAGRTQRVALQPGQAPQADFILADGPAVVYEYCNLHGLWKADVA
jgi:superoxide reductase